jgi:hypothetical protein
MVDIKFLDLLKKMKAIIKDKFKYLVEVDKSDTDFIVSKYDRIHPSKCAVCKKSHSRKGAYINTDIAGNLFLRCYAGDKGTKSLYSIFKEPEKIADDNFTNMPADAIEHNAKYNTESIEYKTKDDLYISSVWGTGKSYMNQQIIEFIKESDTKHRKAKILIITARKSLTAQLSKDLNATSYIDIKGLLNPNLHPVSVFQLESLQRVEAENIFDLILIDEPNSLSEHSYSLSSNSTARTAISILKNLVKHAKQIILTDNDLNDATVKAYQSLRKTKGRVIINTYKPWTNCKAILHKSYDIIDTELFKFTDEQFNLKQKNEEWTGCVVPCHSLKKANSIYEMAIKKYGLELVKIYTGETDDFIKRDDLKDVSKIWDDKLIIIYTSVITVGVSFNSAHIKNCFAYFNNRDITAATSCQMLFRCRQLENITIGYKGNDTYNLPVQQDDLYKWSVLASNREHIPDEFRNDRMPYLQLNTTTDVKDLTEIMKTFEGQLWTITMINRFRGKANFINRLASILTKAGITLELSKLKFDEVEASIFDFNEGANLSIDSREEKMINNVESIADEMMTDPDKFDSRSNTLFNEDDKAGIRAVHMASVLGIDPAEIAVRGVDYIKRYEPVLAEIKNLKKIQSKNYLYSKSN